MISAVDTNILLDILLNDHEFAESSSRLLQQQHALGKLMISQVVYSELLVFFLQHSTSETAVQKLDEFLADFHIKLVEFAKQDLLLAATAWQKYVKTKTVFCPACGAQNRIKCSTCHKSIFWRNHMITDFLIGSHAQQHANVLLTRDQGYYRRYFAIKLLSK